MYIKYNGSNFSIREDQEFTETLEGAKAIILAAEERRTNPQSNGGVLRVVSDDIVIKSGKYGNYIQYQGKTNVSLPKKNSLEEITEAECFRLINSKKKKYNNK